MTTRRWLLPAAGFGLAGLTLVAVATALAFDGNERTSNPPSYAPFPGEVMKISASWAHYCASIAELSAASEAVVVGTVKRTADAGRKPTSNRRDPGTPYTDFEVNVERLVAGDVDSTVIVHQLGGDIAGTRWEFGSDPLFVVGERYLLFLKRSPDTGLYYVAGPGGRFVVTDDEKVFSLSLAYTDRAIQDLGLAGDSLDSVLAQVPRP